MRCKLSRAIHTPRVSLLPPGRWLEAFAWLPGLDHFCLPGPEALKLSCDIKTIMEASFLGTRLGNGQTPHEPFLPLSSQMQYLWELTFQWKFGKLSYSGDSVPSSTHPEGWGHGLPRRSCSSQGCGRYRRLRGEGPHKSPYTDHRLILNRDVCHPL